MLSVRRRGLAMKIQFVDRDVLLDPVVETKSPTLVDRSSEIAANSHGSLNQEINLRAERNRKLNIVPTLGVRFSNQKQHLCARDHGHAHKYENKTQKTRTSHLCLASV